MRSLSTSELWKCMFCFSNTNNKACVLPAVSAHLSPSRWGGDGASPALEHETLLVTFSKQ